MYTLWRTRQFTHSLDNSWSRRWFPLLVVGGTIFTSSVFVFTVTGFGERVFMYLFPFEMRIALRLRPCLSTSGVGEQTDCLLDVLPKLFQKHGVKPVMVAFEKNIAKIGETSSCHDASHVIGELAFLYTKDIGETLSSCTSICHNGCQHGVVGALIRQQNNTRIDLTPTQQQSGNTYLPSLCAKNNDSAGEYQLCIHGLGHAFMLVRGGGIRLALADCDALQLEGVIARQCWTGVFMENARNNMGGGHNPAYVRTNDPFYPCTMAGLDEKYLSSCYYQLPLPARLDQAFQICRTAPPKWIENCAQGIGLGIAAWRTDFSNIILRSCEQGMPDLEIPCLRGAFVYLTLGNRNTPIESDKNVTEFCGTLEEEERKSVCNFFSEEF